MSCDQSKATKYRKTNRISILIDSIYTYVLLHVELYMCVPFPKYLGPTKTIHVPLLMFLVQFSDPNFQAPLTGL